MTEKRGKWKRPGTLEERITWRSKRNKKTGCLEWTAGKSPKGYALIWWEGTTWRVSRLLWTKHKGPIPPGLKVLHKCDNTGCIELRCFFLGDDTANMRDRDRKQRQARGERVHCSKLTATKVRYLRRVKTPALHLARRWHVSVGSICRARNGDTWKHI